MKKNYLYSNENNLTLILKVPSNSCNLKCTYCFENMKEIERGYFDRDKLKYLLDKVKNKVNIVFHGGEPLLIGVDRFDNLLSLVRENKEKIEYVYVQSNGTLIDEEWMKLFFEKYKDLNIEISLSLDGDVMMNQSRLYSNGETSFYDVLKAYNLLKIYGQKAGLLSVISKRTLPYYREYVEFLSSIENIRFVKINALFNLRNNLLTSDSITPDDFSEFIINVSKVYIEKKLYKRFSIEPLLSMIQRVNNRKSKYCNYQANKCFNYVSAYPDGSIGPCDCLSINEFLVSQNTSLEKMMYTGSVQANELNELMEKCVKCDIFKFCQGGCLSHRYYFRNNQELAYSYCLSKHKLYMFAKELKF